MKPKSITLHITVRSNGALLITPIGDTVVKSIEEFKVSPEYLKNKISEIMGLLRLSANQSRATGDMKAHERMKELGEDLYQELIPVSLRGNLEETVGGDLHLYMHDRLVHIPWELLHDGKGFFCRRFNMGRFVHTLGISKKVEKKELALPLRFLSIADPKGNLPEALQEGRKINDMMMEMDEVVDPVLLSHKVSYTDFMDNLKQAHLFHFAGHVEKGDGGGQIPFSDTSCTAERIGQMAGKFSFPSLVFLNGCQSSVSGENAWSLEEGQERTFDFASRFLLAGTRHFIGTLWDVHDAVAAKAGTAFFKVLFNGSTVGEAMAAARDQLIATFGELSMVWAGYILYGNPSFRFDNIAPETDRLWDEICEMETRRGACVELLRSKDLQERFAAAVALFQMGDRQGGKVILKQFQLLLQLLKSPSSELRHRGLMVLEILSGSTWNFNAGKEPDTQVEVLNRIQEWWSSEETRKRFDSP